MDPTGQFQSEMINQVPLRRLGEVEELANLATYLVSDYSSWITGEVVAFDGGQLPNMAGMFNGLTLSITGENRNIYQEETYLCINISITIRLQ